MNKKIIKDALESSLRLVSEEYQSVVWQDLKEHYEMVIEEIETALEEFKK